ncbi:MAG: hypothetical protein COB20_09795, partial [SAR86 cluster bacterium]
GVRLPSKWMRETGRRWQEITKLQGVREYAYLPNGFCVGQSPVENSPRNIIAAHLMSSRLAIRMS